MKIVAANVEEVRLLIGSAVLEKNEISSVLIFDEASDLSSPLSEGEVDEVGVLRFSLTAGHHDEHIADIVIATEDGPMFVTEGLNIHLLRGETQTFVLDLKKAEQKWAPGVVFDYSNEDGDVAHLAASHEWVETNFTPL